MRKTIYHIGMLAAAALAFVACNKETGIEQPSEEVTHVAKITLTKAADTRTAVVEGQSSASYIWTEGDEAFLNIYECYTVITEKDGETVETKAHNKGTITQIEYSSDYKTVTLTVSFGGTPTGPYSYEAIYAKSVSGNYNPSIPSTQKPKVDNFDPAADVLISKATSDVTGVSSRLTELCFTMGRVVTVNKMTLTGLSVGEKVKTVEFSLDQHMAGTYTIATGNYSSGGKKLTFDYTEDGATDGVEVEEGGNFPVYFTSAPVTAAGIESVVVTTDQNVYTKSNTLNPNPFDGKTITFAVGTMKRFTMAMSGYGEEISTGTPYTLVSDEDDLYNGATYLLVGASSQSSKIYALGEQKTNNRAGVEVTDIDGVITIDNTINAYPIVIESVTGGYSLKDATSNQYLYTNSTSSNRLLSRDAVGEDNYAVWTITITEGVASISNLGNTSRGVLCFNPTWQSNSDSNPLFSGYGSAPANATADLALYVDKSTCVELEEAGLAYSVTSPIEVAWDDKDNFVKPTLTNPNSLTVTYASSNEGVATVDASTGDVTFVGNGTTTISASSAKTSQYKAGYAEYQITVTGAPAAKGSEENPYTVAEALTIISGLESGAANKTSEEFCVAGIISEVLSYNSNYHSLTYNITDDGDTNSNFVQIYSGKGINGANFTSISDLSAGDQVVVKGYLMKYNTTPQIYQNSVIVSRILAPYFNAELSANTIPYTGGNSITLTIGANVEWTASINNNATLKIGDAAAATSVSGNSDTNVTVIIPQNTDGATYTISFSTTSTAISAPADLTITQSSNQVTTVKKYVKVTSGTIGGEYLIVYESSKYVFDGSLSTLDSNSNYKEATDLSSLDYDDWKDYAVTIESYSGGYSIKTASGLYMGRNANSNGLDGSSTLSANYKNTITFNTDGTIQILGNGGRKFNYNSSSDKFRYFASSNTSLIHLYQLQEVSE